MVPPSSAYTQIKQPCTTLNYTLGIHHSIGTRAMIDMLTTTSVYVPSKNGCYFQICGKPVIDLGALPLETKTHLNTALTDVVMLKSTIMYGHAKRNQTGQVKMGLPSTRQPAHVA